MASPKKSDFLEGQLNHLSESQTANLSLFRESLVEKGVYTASVREAPTGQPYDDAYLLRFLKSQKFNVEAAVSQYLETKQWLRSHHISELYSEVDVAFFERARTLYGQWTGRRDLRGNPLYVYQVRKLSIPDAAAYAREAEAFKQQHAVLKTTSISPKIIPLAALMQNILDFVLPICTAVPNRPNPETPITMSTNIIDISGVGLRQWWALKDHIGDASVLSTKYYPEILDRTFVIGAPAFFPLVLEVVKNWFQPAMVAKIFVLRSSEVRERLRECIGLEDLPVEYGGNLEWEYGDSPQVDDEIRAMLVKDGSEEFIEGPCLWIEGKRIVLGTVDGQKR